MATPTAVPQFSSIAEAYERHLVGPLFRPWAERLVERARIGQGERVLDVACGTGIVSRLAMDRVGVDGAVVGVDLNPQMLAAARSVAAAVDWREGNALALPLREGESFDVATCHQGLQFFSDKPQAARELKRALLPGGRLAVATWQPVDERSVLMELQQVAERHVGPVSDTRHAFGEERELRELFADAGFQEIRVDAETMRIRFDEGAVFVRLNAMAMVGMSARGKKLTEEERRATVAKIVEESEPIRSRAAHGNELEYDIGAVVLTALA